MTISCKAIECTLALVTHLINEFKSWLSNQDSCRESEELFSKL